MIGKLVRTKKTGPYAPKGTWGIVTKEEEAVDPNEPKIYTVHLSQGHHTRGHFFRNQLQVVEVCSA